MDLPNIITRTKTKTNHTKNQQQVHSVERGTLRTCKKRAIFTESEQIILRVTFALKTPGAEVNVKQTKAKHEI